MPQPDELTVFHMRATFPLTRIVGLYSLIEGDDIPRRGTVRIERFVRHGCLGLPPCLEPVITHLVSILFVTESERNDTRRFVLPYDYSGVGEQVFRSRSGP